MNSNGWSSSASCGTSTLYVNIPSRGGWVPQDAHRYINISGCSQYHVRIWYINNDQVIGAAHVEDWHGSMWNLKHIYVTDGTTVWENNVLIGHGPHDFELGETRVKNTFSGRWSTSANSHDLANEYKREQYNPLDGSLHVSAYNNRFATVINRNS